MQFENGVSLLDQVGKGVKLVKRPILYLATAV